MKQILMDLKGELDLNTIKMEVFNAPLTSMDRSAGQEQQGNYRAHPDNRSNALNLFLQNVSSYRCRIYYFFIITGNLFQK